LDFTSCSQLRDLSALASLGQLPKLSQLTLDLEYCSQLSDLSTLAALATFAGLQQLEKFALHIGTTACGAHLSDKQALAAMTAGPSASVRVC
jgi:hypothetical protein